MSLTRKKVDSLPVLQPLGAETADGLIITAGSTDLPQSAHTQTKTAWRQSASASWQSILLLPSTLLVIIPIY